MIRLFLLLFALTATAAQAQYATIGAADTGAANLAAGATVLSETLTSGAEVIAHIKLGGAVSDSLDGGADYTLTVELYRTDGANGNTVISRQVVDRLTGDLFADLQLGPYVVRDSDIHGVKITSSAAADIAVDYSSRFIDATPSLAATIGADVASELATYNGPTRAEATEDKGEVITAVGAAGASKLTTTIATVVDDTTLTLSEGSAVDRDYIGQNIIITKAGDATRFGLSTIVGYAGASKTVTLREPLNFSPLAGDTVEIAIATVSLGPTNTESVPPSRTVALVPGDGGLSSEASIHATDANLLYAIDFRQDMPSNTQIAKTISVTASTAAIIITPEANGKSASLVRLTGVSATPDGSPCIVSVVVQYEDQSVRTGTVSFTVKE